MKLYYAPGTCSLSPHILSHEAGIPLELVKVDIKESRTEHGVDFKTINPKGYVPALELDDGRMITEGVAIDLYLSQQKPEAKLMPGASSSEFLDFFQQMLFITTELHKGMGSLFAPIDDAAKTILKKKLRTRLAFMAGQLAGKEFVFGEHFSAADAYLYTVLRWAPMVQVDLVEWPVFGAFMARMESRPAVRKAVEMEGVPLVAAAKAA